MSSSDPFLIDSHKLQYHPERVAQWINAKTISQKLEVFPIYVEVSPVGHCNHRCTFCAVDYIGYKPRSIAKQVLIRAIGEMHISDVKSVMFAGEGEPLLHPDIAEIVEKSNKVYRMDLAFTTNGVLLNKIIPVLDCIKWIKISINGGEATYAKIHKAKEGDWQKVWQNIERAVAHRRDHNLSCAIGAQTVILPDNLADIPGLVRHAKNAGCDYIVLKPYSQHKSSETTTYADVKYNQESFREIISEAQQYSTDKFKVIARLNAMEDWDNAAHTYHTCNATPYFWAYIMATGDVYSCSAYLLNDKFNLGNINSTSFYDIWTGPRRRQHLVEMESLDISQCRVNCRMNQANKFLSDVKTGNLHENFI